MPAGPGSRAEGPPAPLRVLELAQGTAGPACGRLWAALGHDVIKCEPPGGDYLRRRGPADGQGRGFSFAALNAGKRSVVASPADSDGWEQIAALLDGCDVLLTDIPASEARGTAIEIGALRSRWPALVIVAVTPFGYDDPRSASHADSMLAESYGGMAAMIGEPDRRPLSLGGEQAAHAAGFAAFLGGTLAVIRRGAAGAGDFVDVAACDVVAYLDWKADVNYATHGQVTPRSGALGDRWRIAPAADGWVGVIFQPDRWKDLVDLIGDDRLRDPALQEEAVRERQVASWWPAVTAWTQSRGKESIYAEAQRHGLPFGFAANMADICLSAQYESRGFVIAKQGCEATTAAVGSFVHCDRLGWRAGEAPGLDAAASDAIAWRGGPGGAATARAEGAPSGGMKGQAGSGRGPLADVVVVDFGTITAGAAVGRLLADYGALVIKVESAGRPDSFRRWLPKPGMESADGSSASPLFESNNAGKLGIKVDLTTEAGRAVVRRLIAEADVVIENFRVGVTAKLGIGFEDLKAVNPGLIYLSLSSQGQTGPEAGNRSYGSTLDLLSGLASVTGYEEDGRPLWSTREVNYPDQIVSLVGAGLVTYCLERGLRGIQLDVSQREVVTWTLQDSIAEYLATGHVPGPAGNQRPGRAPHEIYPCAAAGQWVAISCETDEHRGGLLRLLELPDGQVSEQWWLERRRDLDARISQWTSARSRHDCVEQLEAAGMTCAPVLDAADRQGLSRFTQRRVYLNGATRMKGYPFVLADYKPPAPAVAPQFGEHTALFTDQAAGRPVRAIALEALARAARHPMAP
jgi:crotonobetainyl-CoA:carnitine CoA-transferase CaiB-like acyl-CoA transferase